MRNYETWEELGLAKAKNSKIEGENKKRARRRPDYEGGKEGNTGLDFRQTHEGGFPTVLLGNQEPNSKERRGETGKSSHGGERRVCAGFCQTQKKVSKNRAAQNMGSPLGNKTAAADFDKQTRDSHVVEQIRVTTSAQKREKTN